MSNKITMVDLFCGAGIGAVGFKKAGFDILYAIDNKQYAVDTYTDNIGDHAVCKDIRTLDISEVPDCDVITGGFPCLPFSYSGNNKGTDDEKHGDLVYHFRRIIEGKKPKALFIENVKGLISKKHIHVFHDLLEFLEGIGYTLTWKLTNSIEYGIPQKRERVFIVGIRKDLDMKYEFPEPTNEARTIRDAIGDMPEPDEEHDFKNHYGLGIRNDELPFVHKIPIGCNWKSLPIEDQKKFLGKSFYGGGGRTGFLRKMSFDKHSLTITSTMDGKFNAQIVDLRDKYNDPDKAIFRRFTVRECLRLQSVPDSFYFDDNITIRKQYERCSGIPSHLSYIFTKKIYEMLNKTNNNG